MRLPQLVLKVFFVVFLGGLNSVLANELYWPYDELDMDLPETHLEGKLDNGLRYIIVENNNVENHISMRLYVNVGSINEPESQRGFSHFVEHMGSQGTINFVPGESTTFFNKIGMRSGPEINAFTDVTSTVYHVEVTSNPYWISNGLMYLRDVSDGMLLPPLELENERRVIKSEERYRNDSDYRNYLHHIDLMYTEEVANKFRVIGEPESLTNANRDSLNEFYKTHYHSENIAIVIVGDVDPEKTLLGLKRRFGSMEKRVSNRNQVTRRIFKNEPSYSYQYNKDQLSHAYLYAQPDIRKEFGSEKEFYLNAFAHNINTLLINRRASQFVNSNLDKFASGGYQFKNSNFRIGLHSILLSQKEGSGLESLESSIRLIKQVIEFGFTEEEVKWGIEQHKKNFNQFKLEQQESHPSDVANIIIDRIKTGRAYVGISLYEQALDRYLGDINKSHLDRFVKAQWDLRRLSVLLYSNQTIPIEFSEANQTIEKVLNEVTENYSRQESTAYQYLPKVKPAKIKKKRKYKSLYSTEVRYKNNAIVSYQRLSNISNRTEVLVKFGNGINGLTQETQGMDILSQATFLLSDLGSTSSEVILNSLQDKGIQIRIDSFPSYFLLQGNTKTSDLHYLLEVLSGFFTEPEIRIKKINDFKNHYETFYNSTISSISHNLSKARSTLYPKMQYWRSPPPDIINNIDIEKYKLWLNSEFLLSKIRVSIVGDFEEAKLNSLLTKTFATLPKRNKSKYLPLHFNGPDESEFKLTTDEYNSNDAKSILEVYWEMDSERFSKNEVSAFILSKIFERKIIDVLREKKGASYAPVSGVFSDISIDSFSYLYALIDLSKDDVESIYNLIKLEALKLSKYGVSNSELEAIKPQIYNSYQQWLGSVTTKGDLLLQVYDYPEISKFVSNINTYIENTSSQFLSTLSTKHLDPKFAIGLAIVPK